MLADCSGGIWPARLYYSRIDLGIDLGMYPEIYSNAYFREIQLQRARGNAS